MSKFSKFDYESLQIGGADLRASLINMARTSEAVERYEDMCEFMKKLVIYCCTNKKALVDEERNLLSVAYKNVIGARRASWRTLCADCDAQANTPRYELIVSYKKEVEKELQQVCQEVLSLLEENLLPPSKDEQDEATVFYLKMIGDYYRYLAESSDGTDNASSAGESAATHYKEAFEIASQKLAPTHPIRLGLALNYSVCFYEILKKKDEACTLAKKAFDDAIAKLDLLEEADYKDSTLIMQLLRDNLTLWTNDDSNADEDED